MFWRLLGFCLGVSVCFFPSRALGVNIQQVNTRGGVGRWDVSPQGEVSLSIPLNSDSRWEERVTDTEWRLALSSPPEDLTFSDLNLSILGGLKASRDGQLLNLSLAWKYWCPTRIEWDAGGQLRVTFETRFEHRTERTVVPGVNYLKVHRADGSSPITFHVLRVDLKNPKVTVRPVLAGNQIFSVATIPEMVKRNGAVGGINGAYFSMRTLEPLGLMVLNGELVSGPLYHRSALLFGEGRVQIRQTALGARLTVPGGETFECDGVNIRRGLNRLVVYNSRFGDLTPTSGDGIEAILDREGRVVAFHRGPVPIPSDGWVISAHGQAARWLLERISLGDEIKVSRPLFERMADLRDGIGAGPRLLSAGRLKVQAAEEKFLSDVSFGLAPRSAVGLDNQGHLILCTVEGRYSPRSVGVSLSGLASLLVELGATDALNFDGGGSTQMVVGGELVSRPSEPEPRAVNNGLLIFYDSEAATHSLPQPVRVRW